MTFNTLGISAPVLKALTAEGYEQPTPIQAQAIPLLLEGRDLLGCAQTGTGKTAAFSIPILEHLLATAPRGKKRRPVRSLIVTPTRELALQISTSITAYSKFTPLRCTAIYGGVKQGNQTRILAQGVDILVATPGRLLDLIQQGFISLRNIEYFVLDEADQMLDMGFIHDIKRIIAQLPEERQSLFFSATMPPSIRQLARQILTDPARVTIRPDQPTADRVEQSVYYVRKNRKFKLLLHMLREEEMDSTLVFSRTKHGANRIARQLTKKGIKADSIHGDKSQNARQKALNNFKNGRLNVLVATDIAARGIDVAKLSHVINYDLPNVPETYVHRIGRTGRAGESGQARSFCAMDERPYLKDIQRLISQEIPLIEEHPFVNTPQEDVEEYENMGKPKQKPQGRGKGRNQSASPARQKSRPNNGHRKKRRPSSRKKRPAKS